MSDEPFFCLIEVMWVFGMCSGCLRDVFGMCSGCVRAKSASLAIGGCMLLILYGNRQHLSCVSSCAEAVVGTFAHQPYYSTVSVSYYELATLGKYRAFAVGKIIAYEFGMLHSEWCKAVAIGSIADGKRPCYHLSIERYAEGGDTRLEVVVNGSDVEVELQIVCKRIESAFGNLLVKGMDTIVKRLNEKAVAIETQFVCIGGEYTGAVRLTCENRIQHFDLRRSEATRTEDMKQHAFGRHLCKQASDVYCKDTLAAAFDNISHSPAYGIVVDIHGLAYTQGRFEYRLRHIRIELLQ